MTKPKLTLKRETLMPLTADDLVGVHGGAAESLQPRTQNLQCNFQSKAFECPDSPGTLTGPMTGPLTGPQPGPLTIPRDTVGLGCITRNTTVINNGRAQ